MPEHEDRFPNCWPIEAVIPAASRPLALPPSPNFSFSSYSVCFYFKPFSFCLKLTYFISSIYFWQPFCLNFSRTERLYQSIFCNSWEKTQTLPLSDPVFFSISHTCTWPPTECPFLNRAALSGHSSPKSADHSDKCLLLNWRNWLRRSDRIPVRTGTPHAARLLAKVISPLTPPLNNNNWEGGRPLIPNLNLPLSSRSSFSHTSCPLIDLCRWHVSFSRIIVGFSFRVRCGNTMPDRLPIFVYEF